MPSLSLLHLFKKKMKNFNQSQYRVLEDDVNSLAENIAAFFAERLHQAIEVLDLKTIDKKIYIYIYKTFNLNPLRPN